MIATQSPAISIQWKPQYRQYIAMSCPIEEIFFGGAKGGGKTDWMIIEMFRHCMVYGNKARSIIFRRSYPGLEEIERRCMDLFFKVKATWHTQRRTWLFPGGGTLKLRFLENVVSASNYQGHTYTAIGFDELTQWPTLQAVDMLRGCLRTADIGIKKRFLLTGNPGGPGHNVVKARYIDSAPPMKPFGIKDHDGEVVSQAIYIPSKLQDNQALMQADPDYAKRLKMVGSKELVRAWLEGDWDIVAGGMFDDVWSAVVHIIQPFKIPKSWRIDRSFDWGASKPFSIGWWAESDGTEVNGRRYPKGTLFRINEWYGWNGQPNEGLRMLPEQISEGLLKKQNGQIWGQRVQPGPADPSIYDDSTGISIGGKMEQKGVYWTRGIAKSGTRVIGWQLLRQRLLASLQTPMEEPGIFFFNTCHTGAIRTLPIASRDDKNQDDVDTHIEDHAIDEIRYKVMSMENYSQTLKVIGL